MDKNWMLDFSGCDGGTIGSPKKPAIWVCGIEWGGGTDAEGLKNYINQDWNGSPEFGYDKAGVLDFYRYNIPHCQNSCHPHLNNPNGEKGDNHGTIQCRTQTSYTEQTFIT